MSDEITGSLTAVISAQIVAARRSTGSTRDQTAAAARAAGAPSSFTAAALRNLEDGRRCPTVEEILWVADALEVPVRTLLGERAGLFGHDQYRPPACGSVEDATRTAVTELGDDLSGRQRALAEIAYALASELDGAGEKRQPAQLAKQLGETLTAIWDLQPVGDQDDDDDFGAE